MSLTFTQQKKPTATLIPAKRGQSDHQTTFQPPWAEEVPLQPGFGHEFGQVDVHSGGSTGQQFASSCPLALSSPRACPFGGACHSCPAPVQAKLTISQPGDKYEQEADRVADAVMAMPEPRNGQRLQRECRDCKDEAQRQAELPKPEEEEEEASAKLLQRQDETTKPEEEEEEPEKTASPKLLQRQNAVEEEEEEEKTVTPKTQPGRTPQVTRAVTENINTLRGGGQPLPESSRAFFEPRFDHDFSRVRVHHDAKAADTAQVVQAKAFTVGRDIVFGGGHYAPDTQGGRRLLAHELAHVVQQRPRMLVGDLPCTATGEELLQRAPGVVLTAALAILAAVAACGLPFYLYAMKNYGRKTDKWRHCWVSCEMSKTCGLVITLLAGLGKEIRDRAVAAFCDYYPSSSICKGGHGDFWDSLDDLAANQVCIPWETAFVGPLARFWRQSCRKCCNASGL